MSELYEKLRSAGDPRDKFSAYVLACYENTEAKKSGKDNKQDIFISDGTSNVVWIDL